MNKWEGKYIKVNNSDHKNTILYIDEYVGTQEDRAEVKAINLRTKRKNTWYILLDRHDWKYITKEQAIAEML